MIFIPPNSTWQNVLFIVLYKGTKYADVAELADAPDLGSGISDVQVQVLSSAPNKKAVKRPLFCFIRMAIWISHTKKKLKGRIDRPFCIYITEITMPRTTKEAHRRRFIMFCSLKISLPKRTVIRMLDCLITVITTVVLLGDSLAMNRARSATMKRRLISQI